MAGTGTRSVVPPSIDRIAPSGGDPKIKSDPGLNAHDPQTRLPLLAQAIRDTELIKPDRILSTPQDLSVSQPNHIGSEAKRPPSVPTSTPPKNFNNFSSADRTEMLQKLKTEIFKNLHKQPSEIFTSPPLVPPKQSKPTQDPGQANSRPTPTQIKPFRNDIPRKRSKSSEVSSDSPTKAKIRKTSADHAKNLKPQSIEDLKITKPKPEPPDIYEPSTSRESLESGNVPEISVKVEPGVRKSARQESDSESSDEESLTKRRRRRAGRKPGRQKRVVTKTQAIHILINRRPLPPSKFSNLIVVWPF